MHHIERSYLMTVYTTRTRLPLYPLGFESSQAFRQTLLDELQENHEIVVLHPYMINDRKQKIQELGLPPQNVVFLSDFFSDLSYSEKSYTLNEFLAQIPEDYEELVRRPYSLTFKTDRGYTDLFLVPNTEIVNTLIEKDDQLRIVSTTVFTSKKYLTYQQDGSSVIYDSKGHPSLTITKEDQSETEAYAYKLYNQTLSRDELLLYYLKDKVKAGDIILNDEIEHHSPLLERFAACRGASYYSVLHHSPFVRSKDLYSYPTELLTAHPLLSQHITNGSTSVKKAGFLHPIAFETTNHFPNGLHTKKAFVAGNFTDNKRVNLLIEAFKHLPDWTLDIYGGTQDEIRRVKETVNPSPNIQFKGYVPTSYIRQENYAIVLSASASEAWANSVLEGMAKGCIPVLADSLYQLKYINDFFGYRGFTTSQEVVAQVQTLAAMSNSEREHQSNKAKLFIKKYASFEEAKARMSQLLDQAANPELSS